MATAKRPPSPSSRARAAAPETGKSAKGDPRTAVTTGGAAKPARRAKVATKNSQESKSAAKPVGAAINTKMAASASRVPGAPLARYHAKRDFRRTPEPAGAVVARSDAVLQYVIHKHWATRLHYDLRLELDGTMHSWAVPKGPSLDPRDKRLAVQVEDHPIDYNDFEGQIPAGEYGGGRVIIWDRGTWEPTGGAAAARAGLQEGELKFRLHGAKLTGLWALVRMKPRAGESKPAWLLIKDRDDAARPASEFDVTEAMPDSVGPAKSKAKPEAILASTVAQLRARKQPAAATDPKPTRLSATARQSQAAVNTNAPKPQPLPATLAPQLASLVRDAPNNPADWLWELKFDGYRLLARIDGDHARLFTRNGLDWSARMPELARALAALPVRQAWLDGEVVMPGADGLPDFGALQNAFDGGRSTGLMMYLFDLLHLDGTDLRKQPMAERRAQLEALLGRARLPKTTPLRLSEVFDQAPHNLVDSACRMGMEGIIGKRRDAPYRAGRSTDWIKLKCGQGEELVIAGYTEGQGGRSGEIGALVMAAHDAKGQLRWAGNVGSGFDARTLALLKEKLTPLKAKASPLDTGPQPSGHVHWVRPELVAQVSYAGWTRERRLRHGVFRSLREDKPAVDVVFEQDLLRTSPPTPDLLARAAIKKGSNAAATPPPAMRGGPHVIGGQTVSSPDRVVDPSTGVTKLDVARYYATVAPLLLPHLDQRPVALVRAPDGIQGERFFQKHLERITLPGVIQLDPALDPGHASLLEIDNLAGLMGAVQMNTLELHTWNARHDRIERPDRFTLDLDPGEGVPWEKVQEAALLMRTLLTELGFTPFLKTSGGKGLHVVTPIKRLHDWDTVKGFTKQLVEHLARLMPDRFTAISGPKNRIGKIYPDYLRNGRGATTVSAWSTRARPGMGISVPIAWNELAKVTGSAHWHLGNIDERLRVGDGPWNAYTKVGVSLSAAISKLRAT